MELQLTAATIRLLLLLVLMGAHAHAPRQPAPGIRTFFGPDNLDFVHLNWQQQTAVLRAVAQPRSWKPSHQLVASSELDWAVFSGIGLEERRPRDFDERDLKLVRRHRRGAEQTETWLQSLAWRKIVDQTADTSDKLSKIPGHGDALNVIHGAFNNGFSVVVNMLNHRLNAVGSAALELSRVVGSRVNTNLYLTPGNTASFEPHFDWMESIIVQIEGRKTWRIFEPLVRHPRPRHKFKPRASELGQPVQTIELRTGDVLYLPAGVPHECETTGAEASMHVTFGAEIDEELTWTGALLMLWDSYVLFRGGQFMRNDLVKCDGSGADVNATIECASPLFQTVAVAVAIHAASEHDPLLRRAATPIPRIGSNETEDTTYFRDELLRMARRVLSYTGATLPKELDVAARTNDMTEPKLSTAAQRTASEGWTWIAALAQSTATKNITSTSKPLDFPVGLEGFVEVDGNAGAQSMFADGRSKLELAAQRCADDLSLRVAARYHIGNAVSDRSCSIESGIQRVLERLGNLSHAVSGEPERNCMSDHQNAQFALAALVSAAADLKASAHTFRALLAARDTLLQQAAEQQHESLRLHAAVRNDSDLLHAWDRYQLQRSTHSGTDI